MSNAGELRNWAGRLLAICLSTTAFCHAAQASEFDKKIVVIDYDQASVARHGEMPTRAVLAKLVEKIKEAKPKSIALKFFFDTPGVAADSALLAEAMSGARVLLQASISEDPPTSSEFQERFYHPGEVSGVAPHLRGTKGWLPQRMFANKAEKVCFVDVVEPLQVPMLAFFHGRAVQSLWSCILADAYGEGRVSIKDGRAVFGKRELRVDAAGQVKVLLSNGDQPRTRSAADLLAGRVAPESMAGKVVIVVYTGPKSPSVQLGGRDVKVHDAFILQLRELDAMLKPVQ